MQFDSWSRKSVMKSSRTLGKRNQSFSKCYNRCVEKAFCYTLVPYIATYYKLHTYLHMCSHQSASYIAYINKIDNQATYPVHTHTHTCSLLHVLGTLHFPFSFVRMNDRKMAASSFVHYVTALILYQIISASCNFQYRTAIFSLATTFRILKPHFYECFMNTSPQTL